MNKTSGQTSLWLAGSLRLQDRRGWTFDEDQKRALSSPLCRSSAEGSQHLVASKQHPLYVFYLMTHWHLSHTPTMNYKSSVQTARVQFSLEMLGQVVLQGAEPLTGALFLCNFTTTKCWGLFKNGIKGNKDGEKQKGGKMRFLSENYRNQTKIKDDWRISSSASHYAEEREAQQKNMRQKKTNTEGIWKKPHVALL